MSSKDTRSSFSTEDFSQSEKMGTWKLQKDDLTRLKQVIYPHCYSFIKTYTETYYVWSNILGTSETWSPVAFTDSTQVDEWSWYRHMLPVHVSTATPWEWPAGCVWSESPGLKLTSGKSLYVLSTSSTPQVFIKVTAKILLHCAVGIQWLHPGRTTPRPSS